MTFTPNWPTPEEWVEALESGRYSHAIGALRKGRGYCCLGVLAEMAGAVGAGSGFPYGLGWPVRGLDGQHSFDPVCALLQERQFRPSWLTAYQAEALADLNDESESFEPVIKRIKETLI